MKKKQFTLENQLRFAKLSGDYNPIHIDKIAARRMIFGMPIVHGIHALLWALDTWLQNANETISISSIKVFFEKPIGLDEEISLSINNEILEDIVHIASGDLRKAIYLLELLNDRNLLNDRETLHKVIASTTFVSTRRMIENALLGNVIQWGWEQRGNKNLRVRKGALNELDILMKEHSLDAEDIVNQIHELLLSGRFFIKQDVLTDILTSLSKCNIRLNRSMHPRIQLEAFLHEVATIGRVRGVAIN